MSLTATEKQMWIERIRARLGRRITQLETDNAPALRELQVAVRTKLLKQLGLTKLHACYQNVLAEEKALDAKKLALQNQISGLLGLEYISYPAWSDRVEADLKRREDAPHREARARTPWGKEINTIRAEQAGLVDTVLIATSGRELKGLWLQVDRLLGIEHTPLQAAALADGDDHG